MLKLRCCWQKDNVCNQREHVVHLLANEQSQLRILEETEPRLDADCLREGVSAKDLWVKEVATLLSLEDHCTGVSRFFKIHSAGSGRLGQKFDLEIEDLERLMSSLSHLYLSPFGHDSRAWSLSSLVALKKANTNDMIQLRRSYKALSLDVCLLCMESGEMILDEAAVRNVFMKSLGNYINWCTYLCIQPAFSNPQDVNREKMLLFVSLNFLIWGEAANIRFLPECLCYLFHHVGQPWWTS
ncbi:Callose synthase 9 [Vitis vinifera]|uniref:Callose synthase 9 n=1 Tax=Vitis vinifera TaxID=29760 RepID=A0A438ELP0_VITVI|nr:Callose synthase 9 [Vitis vinifera]